jgi:hypothetical protein
VEKVDLTDDARIGVVCTRSKSRQSKNARSVTHVSLAHGGEGGALCVTRAWDTY